ncbi:MAG: porin [Gammaproteobacteria bacterium]
MKLTKKHANSVIILAASSLIWSPYGAQAVEFSLAGQVNRLIMNVDNGEEDGIVHADNSVSGTRWSIQGSGDLDNDMMVGFLYETQLQSNPSNQVEASELDGDGVNGDVGSGDEFSTRHSNIWLKGDFGKVTMGQGSGAADGSAEVDKSGTTVIQYSGASGDLLGSMEYGTSGVTVGAARSNFDGLGRNDNIRYDAAYNDFTLAGSLGNGDKIELSARYAIDNLEIRVGLWDEGDSGGEDSGYAVSASWENERGLNLTGAYGGDDGTGDPTNIYLKAGIKDGDSAYAVDWSETQDLGPGDASSVSLAWVLNLMQGVQTYVSYRVESLDDVTGEDDISAIIGGARVKF